MSPGLGLGMDPGLGPGLGLGLGPGPDLGRGLYSNLRERGKSETGPAHERLVRYNRVVCTRDEH